MKSWFGVAVAAVLLLAGACSPQKSSEARSPSGAIKIRFVTDWRAEAEHGGIYEAMATGEYAKRGLDVQIVQGGPGVNVPQLLAAGSAEMGVGSNSFLVLQMAQQKVPLKAVAAMMQKDPQVLMAHPGEGVGKIADMKGRPIFLSASARDSFWPWLKAKYGFTDEQFRSYSSSAPFVNAKRSIEEGYVFSEPYTIEKSTGLKPAVFLLADEGYPSYAGMILAPDSFIAAHPEAVRAFVAATAAGWSAYLHGDPSPADAMIMKANPEQTADVLAQARDKMRSYGIVEPKGWGPAHIGAMSDERWADTYRTASSLGLAPAGLDIRQAYTLAFAPKGPWSLAALRSVEVTYPRRGKALGPIDLTLEAGEIVALVGPSGCGKSTALRLLAGLEQPTAGAVERTLGRGETAVVFQSPTLMPWATSLANVALPLELAGTARAEARARAQESLQRVGLGQASAAKPAQLSGGMAMRAALARALVSDPRLLLLDEPFAALDEITRRALADDVHRLWTASRPGVVFVTHNVEEAVFMAARVVVMSAGPGRIAGEVRVEGPLPRPPGFRTTETFRHTAEAVSQLLAQAMAA